MNAIFILPYHKSLVILVYIWALPKLRLEAADTIVSVFSVVTLFNQFLRCATFSVGFGKGFLVKPALGLLTQTVNTIAPTLHKPVVVSVIER